MAQHVKQLGQESTSPVEKFRDLTKRLLNVRKDESQEELKKEREKSGEINSFQIDVH